MSASTGKGIGEGTSSLLGKTAYGVSSTATTLSSSLGMGVTKLSMDSDYNKERRDRANKIRSGDQKANFATGVASFGDGLISGVTGVIAKPMGMLHF